MSASDKQFFWLFQPPPSQPDLPVVLLEQELAIEHWRVVVICPHRRLNFGSPNPVAEFVQERAHWLELEPAATDPAATSKPESSM